MVASGLFGDLLFWSAADGLLLFYSREKLLPYISSTSVCVPPPLENVHDSVCPLPLSPSHDTVILGGFPCDLRGITWDVRKIGKYWLLASLSASSRNTASTGELPVDTGRGPLFMTFCRCCLFCLCRFCSLLLFDVSYESIDIGLFQCTMYDIVVVFVLPTSGRERLQVGSGVSIVIWSCRNESIYTRLERSIQRPTSRDSCRYVCRAH